MTDHPPQVMTIERFNEIRSRDGLSAQAHHGYDASKDTLLSRFPLGDEQFLKISTMQNMARIKAQEGTK